MNKDARIYVAGHQGMAGSAIWRHLEQRGYKNLIGRTSSELDLRDSGSVASFFSKERPDYVFMAAARVGGIFANNAYPAEFLYDNLMMQGNVIHQSHVLGVKKLLFLGSSCIYPKMALQPLKEDYLLTGTLESTNEAYAIAKISGVKMCDAYRTQYGCNFISALPTNLYGPNDNYDLQTSHVLPALIRKFVEAKETSASEVQVWGSGNPRREFLHVDDMADACVFIMNHYDESGHINVGVGEDISIADLATMINDMVGYEGSVVFDRSKPDGTPRKLMDVSKLSGLGWKAGISLRKGITRTIREYQERMFAQ